MSETKVPIWAAAAAYLLEKNRMSAHHDDIYKAIRDIVRLEGDYRQSIQSVKTGMLIAEKRVGKPDFNGNRKMIKFLYQAETQIAMAYIVFFTETENFVLIPSISGLCQKFSKQ